MKVDPSTKFWKRNLATLRQPCVLWNNCAIDVDGWMLQCCNWSNLGYNYGNIKEYIEEGRSLRDYWMERLANKQRNSLCRSCNLKHPNVCNRLSDIKVRMSIPSFETRQARAHI
jgi:radical SAM protein with 4Fe4S-binding SPASM domain